MVNPGDAFPPGEDWIVRKLEDLQRQINANASARSLEASSIGSGGLTIKNGGSINVEPGGNITLSSGTFSASVVNGSTSVNAPTINGTSVVTGATLQISGSVKLPAVYSTPVTTSFRVVYNGNGDGTMGYNLSSRRFKQDIESYTIDASLLRQLRIVTFRYIAAVEKLGEDAAVEVGLIAEEVHDLGLTWLVDYDDEGRPEGLKFDRLAVAALALAQDAESRLARIEKHLGI